ncbi:uncharacterized protein TRAVEDRAFT_47530 [Trametes versicolor FP-101664 SS1]|uniref:uncharacterized protein n=1 Tax=Trametes versicolor (strain FP-101664) TaxID=717944 RepID=UPI000462490D|nr:uncharacterized protein TRAVEDRAFT_47530 [Trametes versicolor FP-101664 SS1]EIW58373.1 hypothetical protein TRAVEDRAFT_47530 [Trametes versicolor FP-101664 SS1]
MSSTASVCSGRTAGSPASFLGESEGVPYPCGTPRSKRPAEVAIRSADGAEFFVPRQFVLDALQDMYSPRSSAPAAPPSDLREMLNDTVQTMIELTSPDASVSGRSLTFSSLKPVLRLFWHHNLSCPSFVQAALGPVLAREPLRVYALAAQYDQVEPMQEAARACLRHTDALADAPELDEVASRPYRRLLLYRRACVLALSGLPSSYHDIYETFGRDWAWLSCSECLHKARCDREASWFLEYYDYVLAVLENTPHPDALREKDLRAEGIARAATSCTQCASSAEAEVDRFLELLIRRVDRRISKVTL